MTVFREITHYNEDYEKILDRNGRSKKQKTTDDTAKRNGMYQYYKCSGLCVVTAKEHNSINSQEYHKTKCRIKTGYACTVYRSYDSI